MQRQGYGRRVTAAIRIGLFFFLPLVSLVLAAGSALAAGSITACDDGLIEIAYRFQAPAAARNGEYDSIRIAELPNLEIPGEPRLPVQPVRILIPFGRQAGRIEVLPSGRTRLAGAFRIEPAQQPVPLSAAGPIERTPPDPRVYQQAAAYPGRAFDPPGGQSKRTFQILETVLYPVEYQPQSGAVYFFKEMRVRIELEPTPLALRQGGFGGGDRSEVQGLVDNPLSVESYPAEADGTATRSLGDASLFLPPGDFKYVIITNNALATSDFTKLIAHKQARGTTAKIVTTEYIYANYPGTRPDGGSDNPTRIRNFIADAHAAWGTEYVLLGGASGIVPERKFPVVAGPYTEDIPADLYYGCLDGSFDEDADGVYGEANDGPEGKEVDLYHEVYVGRAAVENATEAANFVAKTLYYDMTADSYLHIAGMLEETLAYDQHSPARGYLEEVRLGTTAYPSPTVGFENSASAGFFITHHSQDPSINGFPPPLYDTEGNHWRKERVIDWINKGLGAYKGVHILDHLGHSNYSYCMRMERYDLSELKNARPFFAYSQGCNAGGFDRNDCFAEELTSMKYGAFAAIMNSRYGWSGVGNWYNRDFWHGVFTRGIVELGRANAFSKEYMGPSRIIWGASLRWTYYALNLFGDPQLRLKVKDPSLVTIAQVSTGKPYGLGAAVVGAQPYVDSAVTISGLGAGLKGGVLVRTAMEDKNIAADRHLVLEFEQDAVVYVAYDRRATALPTWLKSGWTAVSGENLTTTDAAAGPMKLYKRVVSAFDTLTLGGNQQGGPTGALSSYFVIVKPAVEIVSVSNGKPYAVVDAALGARAYIDRDYTVTALSAGLRYSTLVQTANSDKSLTTANHLVLKLHKAATVYIAYDKRASKLPSWLKSGWTLTGESISTTDGKASPMKLYRKSVGAGTQLTLGGNHQGGDTKADSHYLVLVNM
jgi:hypothetical protein